MEFPIVPSFLSTASILVTLPLSWLYNSLYFHTSQAAIRHFSFEDGKCTKKACFHRLKVLYAVLTLKRRLAMPHITSKMYKSHHWIDKAVFYTVKSSSNKFAVCELAGYFRCLVGAVLNIHRLKKQFSTLWMRVTLREQCVMLSKQQPSISRRFHLSYFSGYPEVPEASKWMVQIALLSYICQHRSKEPCSL